MLIQIPVFYTTPDIMVVTSSTCVTAVVESGWHEAGVESATWYLCYYTIQ